MIHTRETIAAELGKLAGGGFIYLASPYSKLVQTVGLDEAARMVALAAGALIQEGVCVFSPIAHCHAIADACGLDRLDHALWMAQCYPMASRASACAVIMFDGWRESVGVQAEIAYFQKAFNPHSVGGLPIVYIEPEALLSGTEFQTPA